MSKRLTYFQYLWKNSKWPLGWLAITGLFIVYWLLFPDNSSVQAIKIVLISWLVLAVCIPVGLLYKYRKDFNKQPYDPDS